MAKRIYRAVAIKHLNTEKLSSRLEGRVVVGCDVAKDVWYAAFVEPGSRQVLATVKWDWLDDFDDFLNLLLALRTGGHQVELALEPTGTYGDALASHLVARGFDVFAVSAKHSHDYSEIHDSVPSSHDGKSAAVVAELHIVQRRRCRWSLPDEKRRELRAVTDELDWAKEDEVRYTSRLEAKLAKHWPELPRLMILKRKTLLGLLEAFGGPAGVAQRPIKATKLMKTVSRGSLSEEKLEAVLSSARQTKGVPMTPGEAEQVSRLCSTLLYFRSQRQEAEERTVQTASEDEALGRLGDQIGVATAAVLYATVGDYEHYTSVGALLKAHGLNLKVRSSGKQAGQLTITKRGPSKARRWLYMAVLRWMRTDPVARAWYDAKLKRNGGLAMKGLVALMRKLLAGLYHVARGEVFDSTKLFDLRRLELPALQEG